MKFSLKNIKLYKIWLIWAAALVIFSTCHSYQLGAVLEPRPLDTNAVGITLAGDAEAERLALGYALQYMVHIPPLSNTEDYGFAGLGLDANMRLPMNLYRAQLFFYPMLNAELRLYNDTEPNDDINYTVRFRDVGGIGISGGAGLEFNFSPSFFIRAGVLYQPEIFSFHQSLPGLRYSLLLGTRGSNGFWGDESRVRRTLRGDFPIRTGSYEYLVSRSNSSNSIITAYTGRGGNLRIPDSLEGRMVVEIRGNVFANKNLRGVSIPDTVTTIGNTAFRGNQLTSIVIPNSVTSMGTGVFQNNEISRISIPGSIDTIRTDTFNNNRLESLVIPLNITTIQNNAFSQNLLTHIDIPATVTTLGSNVFRNNRIETFTLAENITSIPEGTFENNRISSLVIEDNITSIGVNAFRNNQIENLTIGNRVTSIGNGAFRDNNLSSVVIPNNVTTIGDGAFQNKNLESVTLGSRVATINANAFRDNGALTSITIPASVRTIGSNSFAGTRLNNITINTRLNNTNIRAFNIAALTRAYIINDRRNGNYVIQGNNVVYNGNRLPQAATLHTGENAYIISINGRSPTEYGGSTTLTRASVLSSMTQDGVENFISAYPARITEFHQGEFYLPPGQHTIEAAFIRIRTFSDRYVETTNTTYSRGLWERQYNYDEGVSYNFTATLDGDIIRYSIERR